ncbi:unnamed protein product [Thelazia callipaeda]|uniref:Uncharacterized protein n=1 Tax=Thelazia callipaeda TaxID=103827 RepID=A0A0N5CMG1_THECL|nr:unnamed protein product [Thelazia callipaeda]
MNLTYLLLFIFGYLLTSASSQHVNELNQFELPSERFKRWTRLEPSVRFFDKRWTRLEPSVRFFHKRWTRLEPSVRFFDKR